MKSRTIVDRWLGDDDEATVNDGRQVYVKDPQEIVRTMVAGITGTVRDDVERISVRGDGQPDERNLIESHHRHVQGQRVTVRA